MRGKGKAGRGKELSIHMEMRKRGDALVVVYLYT